MNAKRRVVSGGEQPRVHSVAEVLVGRYVQRRRGPDPDPSTVVGLVYRVFSRWRIMLGAVVAVLVVVGVIVLIWSLVGSIRVEIGPVGVEPVSTVIT